MAATTTVDLGKVREWLGKKYDWYRHSTNNGEQQWIDIKRFHEGIDHIEALAAEVERLRKSLNLIAGSSMRVLEDEPGKCVVYCPRCADKIAWALEAIEAGEVKP